MAGFNRNNLQAKAKAILEAFHYEMNTIEKEFFKYLQEVDYITDEDKGIFMESDFRYRAGQCGII